MSNKNAATEDQIGILHKLITMCHNQKAKSMLEHVEDLVNEGHDAEEIALAINSRDLATMQKWVEYNGVSCTTAEMDEESPLAKKLAALKERNKGKIIPFADAKEAI